MAPRTRSDRKVVIAIGAVVVLVAAGVTTVIDSNIVNAAPVQGVMEVNLVLVQGRRLGGATDDVGIFYKVRFGSGPQYSTQDNNEQQLLDDIAGGAATHTTVSTQVPVGTTSLPVDVEMWDEDLGPNDRIDIEDLRAETDLRFTINPSACTLTGEFTEDDGSCGQTLTSGSNEQTHDGDAAGRLWFYVTVNECGTHRHRGALPGDANTYWDGSQGVAHDNRYWYFTNAAWEVAVGGVVVSDDSSNSIWRVPQDSDLDLEEESEAPPGAKKLSLETMPGLFESIPFEVSSGEFRTFQADYEHFGEPDVARSPLTGADYLFVPIQDKDHLAVHRSGDFTVTHPFDMQDVIAVLRVPEMTVVGVAPIGWVSGGGLLRDPGWVSVTPDRSALVFGRVSPFYVAPIDWAELERYAAMPPSVGRRVISGVFRGPVRNLYLLDGNGAHLGPDGVFVDGETLPRLPAARLGAPQGGEFTPWGDFYFTNGVAAGGVNAFDFQRPGIHLFAPLSSSVTIHGAPVMQLITNSQHTSPAGPFQYPFYQAHQPVGGFELGEWDVAASDGEEPEGIDWYDLGDGSLASDNIGGQLHAIVVDRDITSADDEVYFHHFDVGCQNDPGPVAHYRQQPAPNAAGWNNTPVDVEWNWTDLTARGLPGLLDPDRCRQFQRLTDEGDGLPLLVGNCSDLAGNHSTASQRVMIDVTAPVLHPTFSASPILWGATVIASPNAYDELSGLAFESCSPVETSLPFLLAAEPRYVTCSATDRADNRATAEVPYTVQLADLRDVKPSVPPVVTRGKALGVSFAAVVGNGIQIPDLIARVIARLGVVRVVVLPPPTPRPLADAAAKPPKTVPSPSALARFCGYSGGRFACNVKIPKSWPIGLTEARIEFRTGLFSFMPAIRADGMPLTISVTVK